MAAIAALVSGEGIDIMRGSRPLSVPLISQRTHSVECGIATMAMLYAYYHVKDKTYESLCRDLLTTTVGTYLPQLGLHLIRNGFSVKIVTHNPRLIQVSDKDISQTELFRELNDRFKKLKDQSNRLAHEHFLHFMKAGGIVTPKIPQATDLEREVKAGRPVVALLTTASLYEEVDPLELIEGKIYKTFHTIVVTGIDSKYVYVNDPFWGKTGGKRKYLINIFLYGVYASALGDLDNAAFMLVRKK
ncbi:C39 family peptidase [Candidatus Gottesmanbacteria bacterium]|nr:C39 family peptidase [Candidatus Gottesmanbacteria bacterium]